MTDKILLIEEIENVSPDNNFEQSKTWYGGFDGIHIKTEKNEIYFLIDNEQNCCESWGYLSSNDDYNEFIGAEYQGYNNITSEKLSAQIGDVEEGGTVFLNIITDRGTLQFAVYNRQNGCYGHKVLIIVNGKTEEEYI